MAIAIITVLHAAGQFVRVTAARDSGAGMQPA